jgi:hypothetical protein
VQLTIVTYDRKNNFKVQATGLNNLSLCKHEFSLFNSKCVCSKVDIQPATVVVVVVVVVVTVFGVVDVDDVEAAEAVGACRLSRMRPSSSSSSE